MSLERSDFSSSEYPPRSWCMATLSEAKLEDEMTSATASACARSIFPLTKARRVYSPGSAILAPASHRSLIISDAMKLDAWHEISTLSSPVYEEGARNTQTRTSSTTPPPGEDTVPNLTEYPGVPETVPVRSLTTLSATEKHSGPLTLITVIAPVPGTVAGATIVSAYPDISIFISIWYEIKDF